jgi:hypothetical protein
MKLRCAECTDCIPAANRSPGCSLPLTCAMMRFVCKRCLDTDLGGQCFREREAGIKEMLTCSDHSFLQIIPGIWSASNKFSFFWESTEGFVAANS